MASEIRVATAETRGVAVELLARFFPEEGFPTPTSRIAETFDRMLADPSCWSALAVERDVFQVVVTVSTSLYVEWGRLAEIGDLHVLPAHRGRGLARRLVDRFCPNGLAPREPTVPSVNLDWEGQKRVRDRCQDRAPRRVTRHRR
jgi:GNAT superfamily N-acetyltransferase